MLGGPRWPISILISGTLINKVFTTCFRPSSVSFPPGPIPFAIYSPDSILHTIVEHNNLMIGL